MSRENAHAPTNIRHDMSDISSATAASSTLSPYSHLRKIPARIAALEPQRSLWRAGPERFIREALGATPTPGQSEFIRAVFDNVKTAKKSGHGVGKTAALAWLIIWFLVCHDFARVVATATTNRQLLDILWPEVIKWLAPSRVADCVRCAERRLEIIGAEREWFAVAKTSERRAISKGVSLQGFHAEHLLVVIDEASGVDDAVFNSLEGALTGGHNRIAIAGNPTRAEGIFYDIFSQRQRDWRCVTEPSTASPIVEDGFVARIAAEFGEDSDMYRVRVAGSFPLRIDADTLIGLSLIEAAYDVPAEPGPAALGVDVARFGDDCSVIARVEGNNLTELVILSDRDTQQLAQKIVECVAAHNIDRVKIDDTGVGGGVTDRVREELARRASPCEIVPVTFGARARNPKKYPDNVTEMWDAFRERLGRGALRLIADPDLAKELSSRKYDFAPDGRLRIESKAEYKSRAGRSPDIADAALLAFYNPRARPASLRLL